MSPPQRYRFAGEIAGFGTASGWRFVVGRWAESPFGPVADVMVSSPTGMRTLLAPTPELADFIAATYSFDAVEIGSVEAVRDPDRLSVSTRALQARLEVGGRGLLSWVLHVVPDRISAAPAWARLLNPFVAAVLPGVRTYGSAGGERQEWYGASDLHGLTAGAVRWQGDDLGGPTAVIPPVQFGFGSTPRRPAVVRVTTTVAVR